MSNNGTFLVSKRLRDLLEEVLLAGPPEDFSGPDDQAIGQVLNDWRVVLARLHAVHNSAGRHTGWGTNLDEQVTRLIAWHQAQEARKAKEIEVEIPEDDEEEGTQRASSPSARQSKRR